MHRRLQIGLFLEVIDHALDHGFEIALRLEPDEFSDLLDVRAATAHVLAARCIGFLVRATLKDIVCCLRMLPDPPKDRLADMLDF